MNEHGYEYAMEKIIAHALVRDLKDDIASSSIQTFREAGVLKDARGLVVEYDGSTFHLTIVQV